MRADESNGSPCASVAPWLRVETVSSEQLRYLENGSSYEK